MAVGGSDSASGSACGGPRAWRDVRIDARLAVHHQRFYPHVAAIAVALAVPLCRRGCVPAWKSARLAPAIAMHSDPNRLAGGRTHPDRRARALAHVCRDRSLSACRCATSSAPDAEPSTPCSASRSRWCSRWPPSRCSTPSTTSWTRRSPRSSAGTSWPRSTLRSEPRGSARSAHTTGVERVQVALVLPVTMSAGGAEEDVVLTAMSPDADFHGFDPVSGAAPIDALAAGDLVLPSSTARQLGVAPGALVAVDSPLVDDPISLRVGALSDEMLGQPAFLSLDAASQLTGAPVDQLQRGCTSTPIPLGRTESARRSTTCRGPPAFR